MIKPSSLLPLRIDSKLLPPAFKQLCRGHVASAHDKDDGLILVGFVQAQVHLAVTGGQGSAARGLNQDPVVSGKTEEDRTKNIYFLKTTVEK